LFPPGKKKNDTAARKGRRLAEYRSGTSVSLVLEPDEEN
jgi:hypothetical protein